MDEFRWVETELEFDDRTETIFTVISSSLSIDELLADPEHPDIICDTYSEEHADLIVRLLNENHAKESAQCTTRIH